ncbi:hypothetical protein AWB74_08901 [Caballeronia arvi]|uniref:Uncharacterized protein n=1 Tax=Caballeronia arvi TaxID=1777135 RepID=A0A158L7C6_9BURK|nr:hypothetical protein AWB74_08901 [Caballeronia arvi]
MLPVYAQLIGEGCVPVSSIDDDVTVKCSSRPSCDGVNALSPITAIPASRTDAGMHASVAVV